MPFVSRDDSDTCIAMILKAANRSIECWVMDARKPVSLSNQEALSYKKRVAFIRNPQQRLHSAFFNARGQVMIGHLWDNIPAENVYVEGRGVQGDYEAFVDYTFANDNNHWKPQVELISHDGKPVPNIYHRMESLEDHYHLYFNSGTNLPFLGKSHREPVKDYRQEELDEKYHADYKLWRSIDGTRHTD